MREVEVSRFVRAAPVELERALSPQSIVEYEGSFSVSDVATGDGETVVTVTGGGLTFRLRFEAREDGYDYAQDGDAGPFERMETSLRYRREDEGCRVTARSAVSLAAPVPGIDRFAAWKRRGELRRALNALAEDVE